MFIWISQILISSCELSLAESIFWIIMHFRGPVLDYGHTEFWSEEQIWNSKHLSARTDETTSALSLLDYTDFEVSPSKAVLVSSK